MVKVVGTRLMAGAAQRAEAVVFDFFGTLAGHECQERQGEVSLDGGFLQAYLASLALTGCQPDPNDLIKHLARFDGAVHPAETQRAGTLGRASSTTKFSGSCD